MDSARRGDGGWTPLLVVLLAAVGVVIGAVAVTLKVADGSHPWSDTVLSGLSGSLFLLAGVVTHLRRPGNRTGLLMMVVGVAFFAEDLQLSTDPAVFSAGLLFVHASTPAIVHLVLAFPHGRLPTTAARVLTATTYAVVYGYTALRVLTYDSTDFHRPENLLLAADRPDLLATATDVLDAVGVLIAAGVVLTLVRRFRAADPGLRAALAPVLLIAFIGGIAALAGSAVGGRHSLYPVLAPVYRVAFCAWPLAFLAGALWTRPRRAVIADLLIAAGRPDATGGLRDTLAVALRDPSLRLGRWRPDAGGFVDDRGALVSAGTVLRDREGRPLGALSRTEVPWEDVRTAEAVAALAALVLDNERLAVEARERLAEVRASRARLVSAADDERRRVERDLHDGAQQQLVVLALMLRMARHRFDELPERDPVLADRLDQCAARLDEALAALRELAHGIHPAVLTEAGLVPALGALAARSPRPVDVEAADLPDLPAPVAATAYFVAAEAVTNALKHARAETIRVAVRCEPGTLHVSVHDDGVGGADPAGGTGLVGLRDRVGALDGTLEIRGGPAGGTVVHAALPLEER